MPGMREQLLQKIERREMVVGVVGLGYVGLPLAVEKAKAGFATIGFDIQPQKVAMVNAGQNYIGDVAGDDLAALVAAGKLRATSDFAEAAAADFIAICVPTPLDAHQQPDIGYVRDSAEQIAKHLKKNSIVVLESTTYPGTTEELLRPILEAGSGLVCGRDFYLGFSPERVDPGNLLYNTKNTPKVVGGVGKEATGVIAAMYRAVLDGEVFEASSPAVAEMEKLLENTYRNVNIGLINELAQLCHAMDVPVWEVVAAARTKPYGFQAFYPGPGLGGHCIPLDPYYLSWKAREYGFHTSMIEASMMINDRMPAWVAERAMKILNRRKTAMNGASILLLGVAYKQDIDDCRESPALRVWDELEKLGAQVSYHDPFVPQVRRPGGLGGAARNVDSLPALTPEALAAADLVIVTAAHTAVDYDLVQAHAKAVFDTKNAMAQVPQREGIELL